MKRRYVLKRYESSKKMKIKRGRYIVNMNILNKENLNVIDNERYIIMRIIHDNDYFEDIIVPHMKKFKININSDEIYYYFINVISDLIEFEIKIY